MDVRGFAFDPLVGSRHVSLLLRRKACDLTLKHTHHTSTLHLAVKAVSTGFEPALSSLTGKRTHHYATKPLVPLLGPILDLGVFTSLCRTLTLQRRNVDTSTPISGPGARKAPVRCGGIYTPYQLGSQTRIRTWIKWLTATRNAVIRSGNKGGPRRSRTYTAVRQQFYRLPSVQLLN